MTRGLAILRSELLAPRRGAGGSGGWAHRLRQDLGCACRGRARRRHDAPLHRPPFAARGDFAAGVRGAGACRARTLAARRELGDAGPQRADHQPRRWHRRHCRSGGQGAGGGAGRKLQAVRHSPDRDDGCSPGHRPRDRPGAGRDAAGHHHRVRRFPHLHPRRLRRVGAGHRHLGGRARAGHPMPGAAQEPQHAGSSGRRVERRCRRQGLGACHHPRHRHGRRHRPCHRIRGAGLCRRSPWKGA